MKYLVVLSVVLFCGCAPIAYTIKDIQSRPEEYQKEADTIGGAVKVLFPNETPAAAIGLAAGYLISFLRRVYANRKRKENENA